MLTPEIKSFLKEHGHRKPEELAFMASKYPELPMAFIAQQVKGRSRIAQKLPRWQAHPEVVFPPSLALEQCSSEWVARYRSGLVQPGVRGIDLTGGYGVDATFLAERFEQYRTVERDEELAAISRHNAACFGLSERLQCDAGDGWAALQEADADYDFIFVDPARRDARGYKVSALENCEPNLLEIWQGLLDRAPRVAVKLSPGLDLSSVLQDLPQLRSVHVISVKNECRELFLQAERGFEGEARIHCVNMKSETEIDTLDFSLSEEKELDGIFAPPGKYLYEPNASIMKAGGFKTVSKKWSLAALNPRTRLYCSDRLIADFPGKTFEIIADAPIGAKEARELFPGRRANVLSRNSGLSTVELRTKLKLKEGGELYAIGAAVSQLGRRLYACKLIAR